LYGNANLTPPDPFEDATDWTDTQCVLAGQALRKDRLNTPNMTLARMIKGLRRLGIEITPSDYKDIERRPILHTTLIREGFIKNAYRVLAGDLPAFTYADKYTLAVMKLIRDERDKQDVDYEKIAELISAKGDFITKDEYRTQEQGLAKNVSVSVVMRAAEVLNYPTWRLFELAQETLDNEQ
jgi:hypothetical protein